jgi:integrase
MNSNPNSKSTGEKLLHPKQLNPEQLKRLQPDPEKEFTLLDGGGLVARVLAGEKRKIVWRYRYSLHGRKRWLKLGTYPEMTLEEAREERWSARKLVKKGIDPVEHRKRLEAEKRARAEADAQEKTVRGLFEDWEKRHLKTWKDGGYLARQFLESDVLPHVGDLKLRDLKGDELIKCLDRIANRGAKRKANMVLSLLKQMLDFGVRREHHSLPLNPLGTLRRKDVGGTEKPRKRTLSICEIHDLAKRLPKAKLPERVELAIWLLLATGCRVGELTKARWSDFDLGEGAGTWTIPEEHSKNRESHLIHLSGFAIEKLKRLKELSPRELLFEGREPRNEHWRPNGKPLHAKQIGKYTRDRQRMKRLKRRTKHTGILRLEGGAWRIHDLRRTMASRMGDLGIAPHVIEKTLNHQLEGILAVYQTQTFMPEREEAFERWGRLLTLLAKGDDKVLKMVEEALEKRGKREEKGGDKGVALDYMLANCKHSADELASLVRQAGGNVLPMTRPAKMAA